MKPSFYKKKKKNIYINQHRSNRFFVEKQWFRVQQTADSNVQVVMGVRYLKNSPMKDTSMTPHMWNIHAANRRSFQ